MSLFLMMLGWLAFGAFLGTIWLFIVGSKKPPQTVVQNWLIAAIIAWLASAAFGG